MKCFERTSVWTGSSGQMLDLESFQSQNMAGEARPGCRICSTWQLRDPCRTRGSFVSSKEGRTWTSASSQRVEQTSAALHAGEPPCLPFGGGCAGAPFKFLPMGVSWLGCPLKQQSTEQVVGSTHQNAGYAPPHNAQLGFVRCVRRPFCSHLQPPLTHQVLGRASMWQGLQIRLKTAVLRRRIRPHGCKNICSFLSKPRFIMISKCNKCLLPHLEWLISPVSSAAE